MDEMMEKALHAMIHKQFETWRMQDGAMNIMAQMLLQGRYDTDTDEMVYAKMIFNAMEIAAELSAKVIIEILLTSKVVMPADMETIRRGMFSVVKDLGTDT